MYTAWVAVLAVLKIQFAQMIALGAAIGDFVAQLLRVPATQVMVHVMDKDSHKSRIVWKSKFYGAFVLIIASSSTPSTRRLLDGVAMLVPHRSTEPGRPRHRREMT